MKDWLLNHFLNGVFWVGLDEEDMTLDCVQEGSSMALYRYYNEIKNIEVCLYDLTKGCLIYRLHNSNSIN